MDGFLTIAEAAEIARLSSRSIRRGLRDSKCLLRHYRVGRRVIIDRDDLERWIHSHAVVSAVAPAIVDRVSPSARGLLDGLVAADSAPHVHPAQPSARNHSQDPLIGDQRRRTAPVAGNG